MYKAVLPNKYQSPRWGAIDAIVNFDEPIFVSIPAMGAIAHEEITACYAKISIPAMGGNSTYTATSYGIYKYQSPQWGAIGERKIPNTRKEISIPAMGAIGKACLRS